MLGKTPLSLNHCVRSVWEVVTQCQNVQYITLCCCLHQQTLSPNLIYIQHGPLFQLPSQEIDLDMLTFI